MAREFRQWSGKEKVGCGDDLHKPNQALPRRVDWAEGQLAERDMRVAELRHKLNHAYSEVMRSLRA